MPTERFSRTELLIGAEGLDALQKSSVTVIGLGAVGSYCVEALARAGVGKFRLVDFDVIRPSNINRHIWAFESTLNIPKAEIARRRVLDINPQAKVDALTVFADGAAMPAILDNHPDIVVDAVDSSNPKSQILEACYCAKMPIIASMGAATRTDPFSIKVGDLKETINCPLARRMRKLLKARGIETGITCVYSTQIQNSDDLSEEPIRDEGELDRGRPRRRLGSMSTLTGLFGLIVAHTVLERLYPPIKSKI